jgi:hypothetical protein
MSAIRRAVTEYPVAAYFTLTLRFRGAAQCWPSADPMACTERHRRVIPGLCSR